MKVLIANKFHFLNGGSESVMFQEREHLRKAGISVVDFSMHHNRNEPSAFSEYFVQHRSYTGDSGFVTRFADSASLVHSPNAVSQFRRLLEAENPDVIHCHNIYHQLTPSILRVAKNYGIPIVLTLHDYKTVCPTYRCLNNGKICTECIDYGVERVVRNRCADGSAAKSALLYVEAVFQGLVNNYELVDTFIAPSRFMREMVTKNRFPREKVRVLHNGVDTDSIRAVDTDQGYILYVGRLSPEKGVETLLRAHASVPMVAPLIVAGTGPQEAELRSKHPSANFVGHLSGIELERAVRDAAVVVVPSEWYENCPMTVLEAMAYAKPVIASRVGGIPELVQDGHSGILFEPGDTESLRQAISRLIADRPLRTRLGAAGRRLAELRFSTGEHNRGLLQIYSDVILSARSPA